MRYSPEVWITGSEETAGFGNCLRLGFGVGDNATVNIRDDVPVAPLELPVIHEVVISVAHHRHETALWLLEELPIRHRHRRNATGVFRGSLADTLGVRWGSGRLWLLRLGWLRCLGSADSGVGERLDVRFRRRECGDALRVLRNLLLHFRNRRKIAGARWSLAD